MFQGLRVIPSDAEILSGFDDYQVTFPTPVRTLPSVQAAETAGVLPPAILDADCLIAMPDGSVWIVQHDYTGELAYINKDSAELHRQ